MNIKEIYTNLLLEVGFSPNEINSLWLDLEKVYSKKLRYYHNLTHLEEMVFWFSKYKEKLQQPNEVLFSIFYHDFVYKVTRKDNELKSAEYAVGLLKSNYQLNKQLVFDLIVATQFHQHNENEDCNWLIDFDLKILSKDWEDYKIYFQQIRKEYNIYPDFLYNPGRKKALEHFLANKNIYQTQEFRTLFEDKARENIIREIQELET
jgi:predicted metal-dependent HD superfamily phosphohydrolase